ncbi:PAS domain S-box protein [Pantanalinema rosaneae CENA516]|uniref:hybrid sensor histidine kinase/response regulator n=1 Tax=Pantanalinema rosaneae TaxID=1620701 RepID=UPI003D6E6560
MVTHRTVLVIAGSNQPEYDYEQQLRQDSRWVYRVIIERDYAAILALSHAQQIDGMLLELSSQPDRWHLLKHLKQDMGDRCPAIVVVGGNDAEIAVQALKHGAADYLVKDRMTAADLCFAMRDAIANAELQYNQRSIQEVFQRSIENMLDCFGIFSAIRNASGQIIDFRVDYLNAMACESNRLPREMQIGRRLCEVLPAHRESGLLDQYCRLVETGEPLIQDSLVYEDVYGQQRLVRAFDIRATKLNDGFVASWRDITDRKQLEVELNQTVADLQTLLEMIPVGIAIATDATCTQMQHNAYLRQLLGVSPGNNISKSAPADQQPPYRVLQNGEEVSTEQLPMQVAVRLGVEVRDIEFDILLPDGTVRQILSYATPLYNNQQQIRGVIGAFLDITERNRAAAALQASQQQLQRQLAEIEAIYQSAPIGLNILDTDLRFVRINQRLADINGLPVAAHLGHTIQELFPALADTAEQLLRPVLETGEPLLNVEIHGETPAQPGVKRVWLEHFLPLKEGDRVVGISTVCEEITERIQIEAALRQREEQFRNMADHAPMMVWVTDSTGYCTYLSKSWYEFTGQTEATGLGSGWLDAVHPDDREFSRNVFLKANADCEAFRLEYRLRHRHGSYHWAIDVANPWFGEAGEFKGYIGSVIDISDRKQAEEALRSSEERYRTLFESMNEGFCVVEMLFDADNHPLDYRFLEVNPVFEQQTGLRQASGKTARQLLPNLEPHWFETYGNVALTGNPTRFESGSDVMGRWFEVAAFRIGTADSRKVAILFKDISDRKQIEKALRQSEERYRYLAEAIPQLVWTCDANGLCDYVNQRLCDYIGLTVEQIIGNGWFSAVHPDDQPTIQTRWLHALHQGSFYRDEYRVKRASDHSYRWHLVLGLPLKDPQGQVVKWFGTCTDIHDQKELDIERDRLLQLERDSREAAERANRIKDEFLAVLSHELRSPLNPILGWSKLLQTRKLDVVKTADALATIERNAKIQMQLIDDLLDIAKILRGKLTLTMTSVNLASVVEAAIETVATTAAAKSISLDAELPNIGQVSGDAARLQQIVWNLLSNAIKFTPSHGRVTIHLERREADRQGSSSLGSDAYIIVTDTGKGISPDFIPYIFESFRQEDASITRRYGGLGLGLAIVRQLVEAHGGTIMAKSPGEGLGAIFTVRLPLLNLEPGTQPPKELPQSTLNLTGVRVLIVDDDVDARELLFVLLTQYGAEVLATASAKEALANLELFQPNVLVSDIGMPDVDGYSLIRQIRTLPPEQGGMIPAIALTAYAKEDDQHRAIMSGYQQHITKPLDPEQLVQAIVAIVHNHPSSPYVQVDLSGT